MPLDEWSTVRVTGADRQEFLNKFCTNDLKPLAAGQGIETLLTDVKGKIVAGTIAIVAEDAIILLTVPGQAAALIAHLDRYCIREDVQFVDATTESAWHAVVGERAAAVIAAAAGVSVDQLPAGSWNHCATAMDGAAVRVVHAPVLGNPAWLVESAIGAGAAVTPALIAAGAETAPPALFHTLRIEAGWPLFGADYAQDNLPQEVGRDAELISFRKGCYLGQETVARIDALGHVNRQLVSVRCADANATLAAGDDVTAGEQVVGQITSACFSPRDNAPLALAMIRRGSNTPGTQLTCGSATVEVIVPPAPA